MRSCCRSRTASRATCRSSGRAPRSRWSASAPLHGALDRLIEGVEREFGTQLPQLTREEKQQAIRLLDERGRVHPAPRRGGRGRRDGRQPHHRLQLPQRPAPPCLTRRRPPDGHILVADHDPAWAATFERIGSRSRRRRSSGGCRYLSIEHVGSTSVPGLAAKPVIDVDIVVARRRRRGCDRRDRAGRLRAARHARRRRPAGRSAPRSATTQRLRDRRRMSGAAQSPRQCATRCARDPVLRRRVRRGEAGARPAVHRRRDRRLRGSEDRLVLQARARRSRSRPGGPGRRSPSVNRTEDS